MPKDKYKKYRMNVEFKTVKDRDLFFDHNDEIIKIQDLIDLDGVFVSFYIIIKVGTFSMWYDKNDIVIIVFPKEDHDLVEVQAKADAINKLHVTEELECD